MWTSDALDDLSYDQEDDGVLVREQLDRVVLARGPWATVMFLFRELDREANTWRAPRMAIVRFQKWKGGYRKHSAFNIANAAQARELSDVFARWTPRMSQTSDDADDENAHDDLSAEA